MSRQIAVSYPRWHGDPASAGVRVVTSGNLLNNTLAHWLPTQAVDLDVRSGVPKVPTGPGNLVAPVPYVAVLGEMASGEYFMPIIKGRCAYSLIRTQRLSDGSS